MKRAYLLMNGRRCNEVMVYPGGAETAALILNQLKPNETWSIEVIDLPDAKKLDKIESLKRQIQELETVDAAPFPPPPEVRG